jgi:hypothetical protein
MSTVHITNDNGEVDQPTINVNRLKGEQVTWSANSGKATIVFTGPKGSPFDQHSFEVPAGGSISSGVVKSTASGSYKYDVVGLSKTNDPVIIVEP